MKGQRESLEKFELNAPWKPAGDQPQAIEKLISGLKRHALSNSSWSYR